MIISFPLPSSSRKKEKKKKKTFETIPYLVFRRLPLQSTLQLTLTSRAEPHFRETRGKSHGKRTLIANRDTRMTRRTRLTVPCCSTWAPTTPWDLHSHVTDRGTRVWGAHTDEHGKGGGLRSCALAASSDSNFHSLLSFLRWKRVISGISSPR